MEARCRDDVVGLEEKRLRTRRVERVHDVSVPSALDAVHRGVQDEAPWRSTDVLVVGREVPRAKWRAREPAELGRPG